MSVLARLSRVLGADEWEQLRQENRELRAELARSKRIATDYFEVIEKLDRQRDEWKQMYRDQALHHQAGQQLLQNCAHTLAMQLRQALVHLNLLRKAADLEPICEPRSLIDLPTNVPEKYAERLAQLEKELSEQTDGLAAREAILSRLLKKRS